MAYALESHQCAKPASLRFRSQLLGSRPEYARRKGNLATNGNAYQSQIASKQSFCFQQNLENFVFPYDQAMRKTSIATHKRKQVIFPSCPKERSKVSERLTQSPERNNSSILSMHQYYNNNPTPPPPPTPVMKKNNNNHLPSYYPSTR